MAGIKKSDYKLQMRKEAKRVIGGSKYAGSGHAGYRQDVEAGRKQYLQKSAEGGDWNAQRIKGEIQYLLNNYLPSYDARIETLIDKWRTSGDAAYDPAIKARYRKVRADYAKKSNPV